jgi:high-affinity iron transporter
VIAAAIIVLREVFEAALVIGIVLAGTRGVARRGVWVAAGVATGVVGAMVVAGFAERIAAALEGVGQELFNASVLLVATTMLGWHNVWMKRHGRELATEMQNVGREVASGRSPLSVLLLVVALAVLREGSEVVLFLYGIAAGGTGATALALGSIVGLALGIAIGVGVYYGLLAIPQRQLFAVTGALLLLLAAGMAAQAAGFLVQAGKLPPLADPVWDSSGLVPEHGIFGQILHALIGYTERPSGMQLVFFAVAAVGIAVLTRRAGGGAGSPRGTATLAAALLGALALAAPRPARADLVVYSPVVEPGERAFELRMQHDRDTLSDRNGAEEGKLEVEYAPNEWWLTEALVTVARDPGGAREATEFSWENVIAFAPQGKYWMDFGLLAEFAHALKQDGHDAIELGLLGEKTIGPVLVTANLKGEQALGSGENAALGYAVRAVWRLGERFEPGLEAFGEFGTWGQFGSVSSNRHQLGPVARGRLRFAGREALRYEFAWVFGLTGASPDSTARVQLEYEF